MYIELEKRVFFFGFGEVLCKYKNKRKQGKCIKIKQKKRLSDSDLTIVVSSTVQYSTNVVKKRK